MDKFSKEYLLFLDLKNYSPIYINPNAKKFLGINGKLQNFDILFWTRIIHPNYNRTVFNIFNAHRELSNHAFSNPIYLKSSKVDDYVWLYAYSKVITLDYNPNLKVLLILGIEIDEAIKTSSLRAIKKWPVIKTLGDKTHPNFTNRENKIISLISREFTSKEIASRLMVSKATIEADRKNILKKLQVKSLVGITKYAVKMNLL